MKIFITGAAGFIGSRLSEVLAEEGAEVLGIDNLNAYYDPRLKLQRLERCGFDVARHAVEPTEVVVKREKRLIRYNTLPEGCEMQSGRYPTLRFCMLDAGSPRASELIKRFAPDVMIHLAAQPGVRYSIEHASECVESNVMLFLKVLENCRAAGVARLLYASSSSVYGNQPPHPFRETDSADSPLSVYAVSKRTNEMLAQVYAEMYGFQALGMRFFTVYGEWGRPDMAPLIFARGILSGTVINLFNGGQQSRDFTYIDDVTESIRRILKSGMMGAGARHEVVNIGRGRPTLMIDFLHHLEALLGRRGNVKVLPIQPGEALATMADATKLQMRFGYVPTTDLSVGLENFCRWARLYIEAEMEREGESTLPGALKAAATTTAKQKEKELNIG